MSSAYIEPRTVPVPYFLWTILVLYIKRNDDFWGTQCLLGDVAGEVGWDSERGPVASVQVDFDGRAALPVSLAPHGDSPARGSS